MDHAYSLGGVQRANIAPEPPRQLHEALDAISNQAGETRRRLGYLLTRLRGTRPEGLPDDKALVGAMPSVVTRTGGIRDTLAAVAAMLDEVETLV